MSDLTNGAVPAAPNPHVRPPYDGLTIALHWTTLALVLIQFASALSIDRLGEPALGRLALTIHRSSGVALWVLVALRLLWRFTGMKLPPFPATMHRWHIAAAHLSEYGLYALLLLQPLSGLADTLFRGHGFDLFVWQVPKLVARDRTLATSAHLVHVFGAYALAGLVTLHAGAALFHRFVLNDGVLDAMLPFARRKRR